MKYAIAYLGTAVIFFVLDLIWLVFIAKNFYRSELGELLTEEPKMAAAAIFYVVYVLGIVIFAVLSGLRGESVLMVVLLGALFGLCCYGTYDMTNFATLKNWPLKVVVVDITWGVVLTSVSAVGGYTAVKAFHS